MDAKHAHEEKIPGPKTFDPSTKIDDVIKEIATLVQNASVIKTLAKLDDFDTAVNLLHKYFEVRCAGKFGLAVAVVLPRTNTIAITKETSPIRWHKDLKDFHITFKDTNTVLAQCNLMGADDLLYIERPMFNANAVGIKGRELNQYTDLLTLAIYQHVFSSFPMCDIALKVSKYPMRVVPDGYIVNGNEKVVKKEFTLISHCGSIYKFKPEKIDMERGGVVIFRSPIRQKGKPLVRALHDFKFLGAAAPVSV